MDWISIPAILQCSHCNINAGVAPGNYTSRTTATSGQKEMTQILKSQFPLLKHGAKFPSLPQACQLHCSKIKILCTTGQVGPVQRSFWSTVSFCLQIQVSFSSSAPKVTLRPPGTAKHTGKKWHECFSRVGRNSLDKPPQPVVPLGKLRDHCHYL